MHWLAGFIVAFMVLLLIAAGVQRVRCELSEARAHNCVQVEAWR